MNKEELIEKIGDVQMRIADIEEQMTELHRQRVLLINDEMELDAELKGVLKSEY